ncbi:MAG: hypothetical protein WD358_09420, partial [Nitriliruptoraceae bacterium]
MTSDRSWSPVLPASAIRHRTPSADDGWQVRHLADVLGHIDQLTVLLAERAAHAPAAALEAVRRTARTRAIVDSLALDGAS